MVLMMLRSLHVLLIRCCPQFKRGLLHRVQVMLITLISLCICAPLSAYAWTGEIQGALTLDQSEVVISGSGKWTDQRDLSFLGSAYLPSGRRLVIKIELLDAEEGQELSFDNPNYTLNYLEFSPRGSTVINTQVTDGRIQVQETYLGLLEMTISASVSSEGQVRQLDSQLLRLLDPDVALPEEVVDDPEFAAVILVDDYSTVDDDQGEGCYFEDEDECL